MFSTSLVVRVLGGSWVLVISPCPCPHIGLPVPPPSLLVLGLCALALSPSLCLCLPSSLPPHRAALCSPRGTWAQIRVGCCLEQGPTASGEQASLCGPPRRPAAGDTEERKSALRSPGEGSQDKHTQPREQEGWKIPGAEASLHHCGLTRGVGREGRKVPGQTAILPAAP